MRNRFTLLTVGLLTCSLMWNGTAYAGANDAQTVIPVSDMRLDEADEWGEWYAFDTGKFYFNEFAQTLGENDPKSVTVMRRDHKTDAAMAQLDFKGLFKTDDFIVNLNTGTNELSWDEQVLPVANGQSTYEGNFIHLAASDEDSRYSMYRVWQTKDFISLYLKLLKAPGQQLVRTYAGEYLSDNNITYPEYTIEIPEYDYKLNGTDGFYSSKVKELTLDFQKQNSVIAYAQYAMVKDGVVVADNGVISKPNFKKGDPSTQELLEGSNILKFDQGPGVYLINVDFFNCEGTKLSGWTKTVTSNVDDGLEWVTVGKGEFNPLYLKGVYDSEKFKYSGYQVNPDISTPTQPYEVTVQERADAPGVYRVVNPFGEGTPFEHVDQFVFEKNNITYPFLYNLHDEPFYLILDTRRENNYPNYFHTTCSGLYYPSTFDHERLRLPGCQLDGAYSYCAYKDGITRAGLILQPSFILRLPGARETGVDFETGEPAPTQKEAMFEVHPISTAAKVEVTYEPTADVAKAQAAMVPVEEYDEGTTPAAIVGGDIPSTQLRIDGVNELSTVITVEDPLESAAKIAAGDNARRAPAQDEPRSYNYKMVVVAMNANSEMIFVDAKDVTLTFGAPANIGVKTGVATFEDPLAMAYELDNIITTDVYENPENRGVYTFIAPWQFNTFYDEHSELGITKCCDEGHNWVVDARDKEHVKVTKGYTGLTKGSPLYVIDNATCDNIYNYKQDENIAGEKFGKVTEESNSKLVMEFNSMPTALANDWGTNFKQVQQGTKPVRVEIALDNVPTGVTTIEVENGDDAEAEFYNLQGIRVANPTNGIYIRRAGLKVEKVVIR